jgi:uncharacterized membrane protein
MTESEHHATLSAAEHKTINRIESFSDIVFGFSLFNLAFNLRVPATSHDLVSQVPQFIVFVVTFGLLCSLWWLHHQVFQDYFKPDGSGVFLNFALLAAVALFSYPLQLYFRFGWSDPVTIAGYAVGSMFVFGIISAMMAKGVWQFRTTLSDHHRICGIGTAVATGTVALTMIVAVAMIARGSTAMLLTIGIGTFIGEGVIFPIFQGIGRRRSSLRDSRREGAKAS